MEADQYQTPPFHHYQSRCPSHRWSCCRARTGAQCPPGPSPQSQSQWCTGQIWRFCWPMQFSAQVFQPIKNIFFILYANGLVSCPPGLKLRWIMQWHSIRGCKIPLNLKLGMSASTFLHPLVNHCPLLIMKPTLTAMFAQASSDPAQLATSRSILTNFKFE